MGQAICPTCRQPIPEGAPDCPRCCTAPHAERMAGEGISAAATTLYDSDADPLWLSALADAEPIVKGESAPIQSSATVVLDETDALVVPRAQDTPPLTGQATRVAPAPVAEVRTDQSVLVEVGTDGRGLDDVRTDEPALVEVATDGRGLDACRTDEPALVERRAGEPLVEGHLVAEFRTEEMFRFEPASDETPLLEDRTDETPFSPPPLTAGPSFAASTDGPGRLPSSPGPSNPGPSRPGPSRPGPTWGDRARSRALWRVVLVAALALAVATALFCLFGPHRS